MKTRVKLSQNERRTKNSETFRKRIITAFLLQLKLYSIKLNYIKYPNRIVFAAKKRSNTLNFGTFVLWNSWQLFPVFGPHTILMDSNPGGWGAKFFGNISIAGNLLRRRRRCTTSFWRYIFVFICLFPIVRLEISPASVFIPEN